MVILDTILQYPLQEMVHSIIGIVKSDTYLFYSYLCRFAILQNVEYIIKCAVVTETAFEVLLQVETYERQITLQVTALQVEDVRKGIESDTQRIFRNGGVQEKIVTRDTFASETACFLTEVVGK